MSKKTYRVMRRSQTAQKNEQNAGKEADDASLKGKGDQDGLVDITI